jgi:hypothetical protein
MQFLDFVAFREISPILTLNIGGIANCKLAESDRRRMMAFDTGRQRHARPCGPRPARETL